MAVAIPAIVLAKSKTKTQPKTKEVIATKREPKQKITTKHVKIEKIETKEADPAPVASTTEWDAKMFIYYHESGNVPCKINGGSIDCNYQGEKACGLGQAYPCSKLRAVCSLSDRECQDASWTGYMLSRYGSWNNARTYWLIHHVW